MGFFKFMGLFQHLNCVFVIISDILFQVQSLFIEHLLCAFQIVSHLNTRNDVFLKFCISYFILNRHLGYY